jgi:hypothetical protein
MKGFIVRQPWADLILDGLKTWEIRGNNCKIRGLVGIVCHGKWIGTVEIIDSIPLDLEAFLKSMDKHQVRDKNKLFYKNTYAWVLTNAVRFPEPKSYIHKMGCVIWVNL